MRNFKTLLQDVATKPPLIFPFIALFHLFSVFYVLYTADVKEFGIAELISIAWMAGFTIFWLGACDLKKWGAWGYMGLTLLDALLFIALKTTYDRKVYVSSIFIIDGIFSFFLLFFYKRFE